MPATEIVAGDLNSNSRQNENSFTRGKIECFENTSLKINFVGAAACI